MPRRAVLQLSKSGQPLVVRQLALPPGFDDHDHTGQGAPPSALSSLETARDGPQWLETGRCSPQ